jgi:hypothetical protein
MLTNELTLLHQNSNVHHRIHKRRPPVLSWANWIHWLYMKIVHKTVFLYAFWIIICFVKPELLDFKYL